MYAYYNILTMGQAYSTLSKSAKDTIIEDAIASDAIIEDAIASDAIASDAIASDAIASDASLINDIETNTDICDNDDLLQRIRIEIDKLQKNTHNHVPFTLEPQLSHIQQSQAIERTRLFLRNNHFILKLIGYTGGYISHQQYIYRHHDSNIYTFWYKNYDIYSIKPFIPFIDDPICPLDICYITLPDGPGAHHI